MRRTFTLGLVLLAVVLAAPGCLVLGLDRFYDEPSIAFDERLLGSWRDADDNVTVTVERSDWRSYRIQYSPPDRNGLADGLSVQQGNVTYLDLAPIRGKDFGSFVVPAHTLVRVTIGADPRDVTVAPLAFDWFVRALADKTLPASLKPTRGERDQILLAATQPELQAWLAARQATDPAFGVDAVFRKQ